MLRNNIFSLFFVISCDQNNGGCSDRADCIHVGPDQHKCVCRRDYVGDGFTCIGDITEVK